MSNPLGVTPLGSLPPPPPLGHGRLAGSSRPPSPTAPAPAAPHGPPPAADPGPASPAQSAGPTARLAMVVDPVPQVSFNAADTRQAAIVYLDAVRQRLQRSDPDTYKRFLDTMKDFRAQILTPPLTVIRIRDLFKDHPDLASGFSQFLPESASVAYDPREPTRKRRPSDPSDLLSLPPGKRARGDATPRTSLSERLGLNPPERPDEIRFVELLRERLPKAVYREYLKLLSLFSYEVIDRRTLLERSRPFFGRGPGAKELARMLREVVRPRFKTRDYVMTSGLPVIPSAEKPKADKAEEIQQEQEEEDKPFNAARKPDVDLRSAKRNGHSYRKYPANFPIAKSSGRDLLCQSVLNDQWVSHPTFISEDAQPGGAFAGEASGTPAHRNHFEDAMHRTEDERLEVDLGIDTNLFLVRLLEPVAKRLRGMGEEEKGKLRLPAWSLGGRSRALPLLALERVYGDGAPAREVLQALSDAPAAAVPVVLARLKAKDEEWKAFRRQRNETVWVPDDAKNFAKALDYRGIAARANDKKAISPKAFLVEIEGGRSGWTAEFPDADVFADVGAVLDYYLGLGAADAEETAAVRGFAAGFVRDFFHVGEDDRPAKGEKGKGDLLFANENVFCFFRLFSTIYSRLLKVKEACKAIDRREEVNDTAVSLGLQEVPATPSADGGSDAGSPPSGPDGKPDAYAEVLRLVRRFLRAAFVELAPVRAAADFEDACRRLLGIHGYPVYTADYLVQSLEKIAFAIASEDGDGEVLGLWREWKAGMGAKVLQPPAEGEMAVDGHEWTEEGEYAERVKLLCKDENCFRVEYNPDNRVLHISVLSKPEPKAVDKVEAPLGMSAADEQTLQYLETVDSLRAIEGRSKHLILKRNLRRCLMGPQRPLNRARQGLVVTFNEQAAMMQYKRDSEDYQYRIPDVADPAAREAGLTVIDVFKKLRQKRNARFVNWLMDYEAQAEYPANADQEVFQLLTGMGPKYGMQNWTTRQETVINRAAALKYAIYRTYRVGQAPRGPTRTYTIDDTDSNVVKVKRKPGELPPPKPAKAPQSVETSPVATPPRRRGPKPKAAAEEARKVQLATLEQIAPKVKGARLHTRIQKLARMPPRVPGVEYPRPVSELRSLRKSEPPLRERSRQLIDYWKLPANPANLSVGDLKLRLAENQGRHRRQMNATFIRNLYEMEKARTAQLKTDIRLEEYALAQLLHGKDAHRRPGYKTKKKIIRNPDAGLLLMVFETSKLVRPPVDMKKLARGRMLPGARAKAPKDVAPTMEHRARKLAHPRRFRLPPPEEDVSIEDPALLDVLATGWRLPRPALSSLRRSRNMKFIRWLNKTEAERQYPPNADDDLDDLLLAVNAHVREAPGGRWVTEKSTASWEDAGLRITFYTSKFEANS